ncbi:hypothetical protein [Salinactinospora qingdaonensis]|uniref:Uncharacterized protein n=1 Tax=Salinactinospora qingdaonensis TaxID=702744 RepID=A0ABP7FFX6_9ACTN
MRRILAVLALSAAAVGVTVVPAAADTTEPDCKETDGKPMLAASCFAGDLIEPVVD